MKLQLRSAIAPEKAEGFVGRKPTPADLPVVIRGAVAQVYKPNGQLLLALCPAAIPPDAKARAMKFLGPAANQVSKNRGSYVGGQSEYVKQDGSRSNTSQTPPVRSTMHGFADRNPRFPFCRQTAFVSREPALWADMQPLLGIASELFRLGAPKQHAAQLAAAAATHPSYVIPGTPFTTITVNGTVAGAFHRDAGDYKHGFGVMSVFRSGEYRGCHLGFPAYGVSVDLQDGDVILFDPHEIHGNTPFEAEGKPHVDFERISVVYYFREKMGACLAPEEELQRAKARGNLAEEEA